jgi:hypothetical protein
MIALVISADVVADGHYDGDLRAEQFGRLRQGLRAFHNCQRFAVEQLRTGAAHDAGVMYAAVAVDAEGELGDALLATRVCLGRIAVLSEKLIRRGFAP